MTPQLQQAIRLLQLNRMELVDAIQAEIEQNPALEEESRPEPAELEREAALTGEAPKLEERSVPDKANEVTGDEANANDIDWQQWLVGRGAAEQVKPPQMGRQRKGLPPLEQAPGTYVYQR